MKTKGPVDLSRAVVVNVDVQRAFGKEAASDKLQGLRDSEDAEVARAAELSEAVHAAGGAVVVTKDWHNPVGHKLPDGTIDNRAKDEFEIYGEHALAGRSDAELNSPLEAAVQRMEAKEGASRTVVPVDGYDTTGKEGSGRIIEVHKNIYDVTKRVDIDGTTKANHAFINQLASLRASGIDTVVITGKIAEVCVKAAIGSIAELFPDMRLVVAADAVSSMPADVAISLGLPSKEQVLSDFEAAGVEVTRTARLLPAAKFVSDGVHGR